MLESCLFLLFIMLTFPKLFNFFGAAFGFFIFKMSMYGNSNLAQRNDRKIGYVQTWTIVYFPNSMCEHSNAQAWTMADSLHTCLDEEAA